MSAVTTGPDQVPGAHTFRLGAAAARRSLRAVARTPGLLINPVAMSLFFLLIYSGQLSSVGPAYLDGTSFAVFVVPLILLTGAFLSAAISGELLVRDMSSGYHDRLVLAHGSGLPFLVGPVLASTVVFVAQAALTLTGSLAIGFRADSPGSVLALLGLTVIVGLSITPFTLAAALRFETPAAVNAVPTAFFGLSFFTGFLAPADQLGGWMRAVARINPLTPILDTMRATVDPSVTARPGATALTLGLIALIGVGACLAAARTRRNTR